MAKKHADDDEPVKNVKKAAAYDDEPASPAVAQEAETPAPREPASKETTDAEDIASLAAAIVALIQQAQFDDLTWPEVDRALRLTSHEIRQNWSATGTVKPAPPPEPEADPELESLSPAPRGRWMTG